MQEHMEETRESICKCIPQWCSDYWKVFSNNEAQRFPPSRPWDYKIELVPDAPAVIKLRGLPLLQAGLQEQAKFIEKNLKNKFILRWDRPFRHGYFFIPKKAIWDPVKGEWKRKLRPVIDYRPINKWTVKNGYPLPLIPVLIDRMRGCTLFTKMDIRWGYNNIQIKEEDRWKAAFITSQGLFEPNVMFFGLTNSPATFQTMMDTVFRTEIAEGWVTIYMDDIGIHTKPQPGETEEQHKERHRRYVRQILEKLVEHDLYLEPDKCSFEKPEMNYLGVRITPGEIHMEEDKVA